MTQTVRPAPNSQTLARVPIESEARALNLEKRRSDARRKYRSQNEGRIRTATIVSWEYFPLSPRREWGEGQGGGRVRGVPVSGLAGVNVKALIPPHKPVNF